MKAEEASVQAASSPADCTDVSIASRDSLRHSSRFWATGMDLGRRSQTAVAAQLLLLPGMMKCCM